MMRRFLIFALLFVASVYAVDDLSTWPSYRKVVVSTNNAAVTTQVTDSLGIPILVRLDSTTAADVLTQADGSSIRFALTNGTTILPHEQVSWVQNKSAAFWVLVPSVTASSDSGAVFRIYWGKVGATSASSSSSVFSLASGFTGVWHMDEAAAGGTLADATGYGHTGTSVGAVSPTDAVASTAPVGLGKHFTRGATCTAGNGGCTTGTAYQVVAGTPGPTSLEMLADSTMIQIHGPFTITAWVNPVSSGGTSSRMTVFSKYDSTITGKQYSLQYNNGQTQWQFVVDPVVANPANPANSEMSITNAAEAVTINSWQYLAASYSNPGTPAVSNAIGLTITKIATTGTVGNTVSSTGTTSGSHTTGTGIGTTGAVLIGSKWANAPRPQYFGGDMDEVMFHNVVRSQGWLKLSEQTQKPGATAVTLGTTQTNASAPTNLSYAVDPATYTVNTPITPNTATVTGAVDSFTVSPALPAGLSLNKTSGTISGTPTLATSVAKYAVTAINGVGSTTDSITITVTAGLAAPTISFTPSTVSDTVGKATTHTPTLGGGAVASCSVSPALPTGLHVDSATCAVSGTPTVSASSAPYSIKATNGTGSDSTTLTLTVLAAKPTISFTPSTVSDTVGKAATHTPSTTGTITGCVSTPTLPTGLSLAPTTCIITGSPSVSAGSTAYSIKATNGTGSDSTTLTLAVLAAKPTISFTPPTVSDTVGKAATHTPATTSTITGCVSTPTLPTGLSLAPTTCIITGSPSVSAGSTAYSIKATNSTGSDSTTLTLAVLVAKPTVSFTPSTVIDSTNKAATHNATTTGTIALCTVSPTLPTGLKVDSLTCKVSGTPTVTSSATGYKIKATNSTGGDSTTLTLSVVVSVGILPGSLVIRVTGEEKPFTFSIPAASTAATQKLTMTITDVYGRTVWETSVNPSKNEAKAITWNGRNSKGFKASAGMYIVHITAVNEAGQAVKLVQKAITLKPQ